MYAPLRVLSQQRLCFVKFILKVPERTATPQHCARETLLDAVQRAAHQRFWPTASSKPSVKYPDLPVLYADGPNQVIVAVSSSCACSELKQYLVCNRQRKTLPIVCGPLSRQISARTVDTRHSKQQTKIRLVDDSCFAWLSVVGCSCRMLVLQATTTISTNQI